MAEDVRRRALAWLEDDPDPASRAELQALLDDDDATGLADRMAAPLTFGIGGISGRIGAGPGRMNRAVVRRVVAGLAATLGSGTVVVVGHTAGSLTAAFADDAARVLAAAGMTVHRFSPATPTPLIAFAARRLDADAAVIVTRGTGDPQTASLTVHGAGGRPILPPTDEDIAERTARITSARGIALADADDAAIVEIDRVVVDAYRSAVLELVGHEAPPLGHEAPARTLKVVHPDLGASSPIVRDLLAHLGITTLGGSAPDGLDAALAVASEVGADLVLATDADGCRVTAAIPDGADGWQVLSGGQVGALLAEDALGRGAWAGDRDAAIAGTVVTSRLLERVAHHHGLRWTATLPGSRWLAHVADQLVDEGARPVLAVDEDRGLRVGDVVPDVDGISAALALGDLAARQHLVGRTIGDLLHEIEARHGAHVSVTGRLALDDDPQGQVVLDRLRSEPPEALDASPVTATWDHDAGIMTASDGAIEGIDLPSAPLLRLVAEDGSHLWAMPDGARPALLVGVETVAGDRGTAAARARRILRDALVLLQRSP